MGNQAVSAWSNRQNKVKGNVQVNIIMVITLSKTLQHLESQQLNH